MSRLEAMGWSFAILLLFSNLAFPQTILVKLQARESLWGRSSDTLSEELVRSPLSQQILSLEPAFEEEPFWSREQVPFEWQSYYQLKVAPTLPPLEALRELEALPSVVWADTDYELSDPELSLPSDPRTADQWFLDRLQIREAWQTSVGSGVLIADVESGFDIQHPDLEGQFDLGKSHDYDPDTDDATKVNDSKMSHGTRVAGVIGATANNDLFGVGVAFGAKLIGSQMANSLIAQIEEPIWTLNTAKAILGSAKAGADVILIEKQLSSLKSSVERSKIIYDAIVAVIAMGIPVVVPAGNYGVELTGELEKGNSGALFVGATNKEDKAAGFSNFGARVDVAAPGTDIYTLEENKGETFHFGGTSAASAIAAGVVALIRSANPRLDPYQIREILIGTGKPTTGNRVGTLIQAREAIDLAIRY